MADIFTSPKDLRSLSGYYRLPLFFPDATQAVVKTLDSEDVKQTHTPGILVNTYHLYCNLGSEIIRKHGGIRDFMHWKGPVISDSGGFQVMSLAKSGITGGKVNDAGVTFYPSKKRKILFTPETSIQYQMFLKTDLMVVLDDFTDPQDSYNKARETVSRTIRWAKRCKDEFNRLCQKTKLNNRHRPYLIAVVHGGNFLDLRKECTRELVKIGFDGLGYGGWPIMADGKFNYQVAKTIADNTPKNYLLYGLGIGKPEEVVGCVRLGFHIFDCVLPTRDARHRRLYIYKAKTTNSIDITQPRFYSYYVPDKEKWLKDKKPVSTACDCLLCTHYNRGYLSHLWHIGDMTAGRLSSIHNLRFYSILMEKLRPMLKSPKDK